MADIPSPEGPLKGAGSQRSERKLCKLTYTLLRDVVKQKTRLPGL